MSPPDDGAAWPHIDPVLATPSAALTLTFTSRRYPSAHAAHSVDTTFTTVPSIHVAVAIFEVTPVVENAVCVNAVTVGDASVSPANGNDATVPLTSNVPSA